jgi:hypothetical protein
MQDQHEPVSDRLLHVLEGLRLPAAVEAAWTSPPPAPAPGQFWRAVHDEVARFVLILAADGEMADVAPVTLDTELTTDEAFIADAAVTDLAVPLAVWLPLRRPVPRQVLERYAGDLHMSVDAVRKLPTGRPLISVLEDRAMERAVLEDDMNDLAAAVPATATLAELLAEIPLPQLQAAGYPLPLVLQLRRGLRAVTDIEAERLAPLAGVSPGALLAANPPLPERLVRDLDSDEGRGLVEQYKSGRGESAERARLAVGYGAYALAARETDKGDVNWLARIQRYVQAVLGGS